MTSPHQHTDALSTDAEALTDNDVPFVEVEALTAKADTPSVEVEALAIKAEALALSINAAELVAKAFNKWARETNPAPPVETMSLCMEAAALQREAACLNKSAEALFRESASLVLNDSKMPSE